ncbi:hypothetical protein [Acetobacter ascendens]|uniref:hypothetical protein n=1 Tax=Acetobacter ascendens TaxID=481146 RepID=UPI0012FEA787|nr:hypothetical protein [Acetobacter ascendens]
MQRAALKLVDTALEESGADATRYVGFGLAALYCGLQPDTFHGLCEKGKGPRCTIVEGNGLFTVAALDEWMESISHSPFLEPFWKFTDERFGVA